MAVAYENPAALGEPLGKYSHLSRAGDLVIVAGKYPPNTLLVVSALVRPELLVEIDAIAFVPGP